VSWSRLADRDRLTLRGGSDSYVAQAMTTPASRRLSRSHYPARANRTRSRRSCGRRRRYSPAAPRMQPQSDADNRGLPVFVIAWATYESEPPRSVERSRSANRLQLTITSGRRASHRAPAHQRFGLLPHLSRHVEFRRSRGHHGILTGMCRNIRPSITTSRRQLPRTFTTRRCSTCARSAA